MCHGQYDIICMCFGKGGVQLSQFTYTCVIIMARRSSDEHDGLFKVEGVDPAEMIDEKCFEFHKVQVEIGNLTIVAAATSAAIRWHSHFLTIW